MENDEKIKLGIVDDDRLIVQLLKPIVEKTGKIKVIFTFSSGNEFLATIAKHKISLDIILLDLRMKNGSGLEVMQKLKDQRDNIKIIVLSSYYKRSFIGQMLKNGVHAFLPKQIDKEDLISTIYEVHDKGHCFSPDQMDALRGQLSSRMPKLHLPQKNGLTEREIEILQLLCQQMNTQGIADQLFISPKTVESHKSNLFIKAGVKNLAGLVIYAAQNKIVNLDELVLFDA